MKDILQEDYQDTYVGQPVKSLSQLAWKFNDLNSTAKVFMGKENMHNVPHIPVSNFIQAEKLQAKSSKMVMNQPRAKTKYTPNTITNRLIKEEKLVEEIEQPVFDDERLQRVQEIEETIQEDKVEKLFYQHEIPLENTAHYPHPQKKSSKTLGTSLTLGLLAAGIFGSYNYINNYQENNRYIQSKEAVVEQSLNGELNADDNFVLEEEDSTVLSENQEQDKYYQPKFQEEVVQKTSSFKPSQQQAKLNYENVVVKIQAKTPEKPETGRFSKELYEKFTDIDASLMYDSSADMDITANTYIPQFFPIEISYVKGNTVENIDLNTDLNMIETTENIEDLKIEPVIEKIEKIEEMGPLAEVEKNNIEEIPLLVTEKETIKSNISVDEIEKNYENLMKNVATEEVENIAPNPTNPNLMFVHSSRIASSEEKEALLKQIGELEKEINMISNSISALEAKK